MKKNYSNILLPLFGAMLLFTTNSFASTNITGGIFTNTTWTAANSPYIINDTVVVFEGVTLTIQPGVTVQFNNNALLEVRGILYAEGTSADSIIFTSSSSTPYPGIYNGIENGGVDSISYCRFSYARTAIDFLEQPIHHCLFNSDSIGIEFLDVWIDSCAFIDDSLSIREVTSGPQPLFGCVFLNNGIAIHDLNSSILNCVFNNNNVAILSSGGSNIVYSTFLYNKTYALRTSSDTVRNCTIKYNGVGIIVDQVIITLNDISDNNVGIETDGGSSISCNSICNNSQYNIELEGSENSTATNNYWCSTDSASIQNTIDDGHKNLNLGLVTFVPFNNSACPNTGSTTGINVITVSTNEISIYPNPTTGQFTIKLNDNESYHLLDVYNVLGEKVYEAVLGNVQNAVNLGSQPTGIYFVCVRKNSGVITQKILLTR